MANPTSVDEARRLMRALDAGDVDADEAYAKLTRSDADTLTLLNRVVDEAHARRSERLLFHRMSLAEATLTTVAAWGAMVHDLSDAATWASLGGLMRALWNGDRKIYTGVLVALAALAACFVEMAS